MQRRSLHPFTTQTPALLLLVIGALSPAIVAAEQSVDMTVDASASATVRVECLAGTVRVVGWDRQEVQVTGTVGEDADIEIDGGGDVDIEVSVPERGRNRDMRIKVDLDIRVPQGASLEVEGLSTSVEVRGISGDVDIESMSGNVTLDGDIRRATIENISGRSQIRGSSQRVDAETVSGTLVIEGVRESVNASTVSGRIEITAGDLSRVELESVSGSVRYEGGLTADGRLTAESYSGNTELILPRSISAEIEVETLSGRIENDLSAEQAQRVDRYGPGKKLRTTLGSGSARIRIESFSGSVKLRS